MGAPERPIVVIPARMASKRLPGKALAEIAGLPMIVQVWRRAVESGVGPVLVAAGEPEIAEAIAAAGGEAVLTRPDHPSGSDRVHEALTARDPGRRHDVVINLQGDLPTIPPEHLTAVLAPLATAKVDIATLASEIEDEAERASTSVVKAVLSLRPGQRIGRALYFTRVLAPSGPGPHYHHIGIYAYRRAALERFVTLPPAPLESRERLEQLRALEDGMRIDAGLVDRVPFGVDTPADLERARRMLTAG
ncbi:MAG: 3-deoxy-manno-octulosonate cytidylyltransferase [Alphaproteobacteria bacterium]|jgi:3-deoxy-manno-octulosonate cytidylyltransferase (CMP-KDO synthetase)|nr:3-deoxy-manno-octulosonate cytidylyltransferase [Alphaproteobacteria bacterium]